MHCSRRRKVCTMELEHLVKNFKNEEIKCILEKNDNPLVSVSDDGSTLLHLAASRNNQELIKYLLEAGYDINAKNMHGYTALMIAVKFRKIEAIKILLDADAEVCVIDESTGNMALRMLTIRMELGMKEFRSNLVSNLKRKKLNTEELAALLFKCRCSFKFVMLMKDYELSRAFLEHYPRKIYFTEMLKTMKRRDLKHVELMIRSSSSIGICHFYCQLLWYIEINRTKLWKVYLECLIDWDIVCELGFEQLNSMFMHANTEQLQILFDSKLDVIVRDKFGVDLRTAIFGNEKVNAIEIMRYRNFNVNAMGIFNKNALYYAVTQGMVDINTRFLLDGGAVITETRLSILVSSLKPWRTKNGGLLLLLLFGADAQDLHPVDQKTLIETAQKDNFSILNPLIARLAIDHVKGVPIKEVIKNQINSQTELRRIFDRCCQQLQNLKTREIIESVTYYTILSENIENYSRYLCNYDSLAALDRYNNQNELHSLYYAILKRKLISSRTQYCFQCDIANIIAETTGQIVDFDNIVVRNISKYSTQWDMNKFIKIIEKN